MGNKIVIVDENDQVVGSRDRDEVASSDIYRVAALWIVNSDGQILLARRSFSKKNDPGKWAPAVAGTVDEGESYEDNILKEAQEELGLTGLSLRKGWYERVSTSDHNFFVQFFVTTVDKPAEDFVLQDSEVAAVAWFDRGALASELKEEPERFVGAMQGVLEKI